MKFTISAISLLLINCLIGSFNITGIVDAKKIAIKGINSKMLSAKVPEIVTTHLTESNFVTPFTNVSEIVESRIYKRQNFESREKSPPSVDSEKKKGKTEGVLKVGGEGSQNDMSAGYTNDPSQCPLQQSATASYSWWTFPNKLISTFYNTKVFERLVAIATNKEFWEGVGLVVQGLTKIGTLFKDSAIETLENLPKYITEEMKIVKKGVGEFYNVAHEFVSSKGPSVRNYLNGTEIGLNRILNKMSFVEKTFLKFFSKAQEFSIFSDTTENKQQ